MTVLELAKVPGLFHWPSSWNGRLSAVTGTVADNLSALSPGLFVTGTILLETSQAGYDAVTCTISELVLGPFGWFQTILFYLLGIMLLLLSWRLQGDTSGSMRVKVGLMALGLAGIGFLLVAIFPTNAAGEPLAVSGVIHKSAAIGVSALSPLAAILLAVLFKNGTGPRRAAYIICIVTGAAGLLLNIVALPALIYHLPWIGALERAIVLNGLICVQVLGLRLCVERRPPVLARTRTWVGHLPAVLIPYFIPARQRAPVLATCQPRSCREQNSSSSRFG